MLCFLTVNIMWSAYYSTHCLDLFITVDCTLTCVENQNFSPLKWIFEYFTQKQENKVTKIKLKIKQSYLYYTSFCMNKAFLWHNSRHFYSNYLNQCFTVFSVFGWCAGTYKVSFCTTPTIATQNPLQRIAKV